MLKRIQKRAERKEREVAPLRSKKASALAAADSGSEQDDESGSEAGSDELDSEDDDDRDELMSMSGEGESGDNPLTRSRELSTRASIQRTAVMRTPMTKTTTRMVKRKVTRMRK